MRRDEAIHRLRAAEPALRARGVRHLVLFGSVARDASRADSDVDVMIDVDVSTKFSLLDRAAVVNALTDTLGCAVDVVRRDLLPAGALGRILPDSVDVF
ncbi:MAG: nucleotidyltransferase domain-containing protein [Reyranellaceae bacterium]